MRTIVVPASWDGPIAVRKLAVVAMDGRTHNTHFQFQEPTRHLIEPSHAAITELAVSEYRLRWACFVSEDNGQGGITLSLDLLHDLGRFPIDLWLDIYAGSGNSG